MESRSTFTYVNSSMDCRTIVWLSYQPALLCKSVSHAFPTLRCCQKQLLFRSSPPNFGKENSAPAMLFLVPLLCTRSPQVLVERKSALSLSSEEEGSLWDGKKGDLNEPLNSDGCPDESISVKKCKEIERRRKIGLANKGKVPWNKGRKHSAETKARIKQRTVEALRDPKVRKKMSERPRSHTEQSRSRLGLALKKVWARRLRLKKLQQKCYLEWNQLIAEEAKKGWDDQPQLEWDSVEKMQAENLRQHLLWLQSKAEEKRIAKVRAVERAKIRAEKMAMLVKLQKEREDKKEAKIELRKKMKLKYRERKKELATVRNLKLKARLIKIHRKKQINGVVSPQEESRCAHEAGATAEKWDLDYIMNEKVEHQLSFEDLLRAAKNKSERAAIVNDVKSMESVLENHFICRDNDCSFPGTKFFYHQDEFSH